MALLARHAARIYAVLVLYPFAVRRMLGVTVPIAMAVSRGVPITLLPWVLVRWRPRCTFPARSMPVATIPEAVNQ